MYLHLESKTELVAALRARHVDRFSQGLTAILTGPGRAKPMARLDRFVDECFAYSMTHRDLHHLLFHEAGFGENDTFVEVKTLLRAFIERGIQSRDFANGDAEVVTDFLISGIHGSLVTALHASDGNVAKYVAGAKQLARRILAPGAPFNQ